MYKFFKKILLISILCLSLFKFLDTLVTIGLRRSNMVMYHTLTQLFNGDINADLIINGSSKAYVQMSPRIIDSILQMESYNLGLDGTAFVPQKMQYDLYKKYNRKPKHLIQVVDFATMAKAEGDLYNYIKFAPYLNFPEVEETTRKYNGFTFLDYNFPFLKYSGKPVEVIDGLLSLINVNIANSSLYKGYLEQNKKWDNSFKKFKDSNPNGIVGTLDEDTCKLFESYIKECILDDIQLYLIYPPVYYEFVPYNLNNDIVINYFNTISKKYNIHFLNFYNDEISLDKSNFYNSQHLNRKGAEKFTLKLSSEINKIILKNNNMNQ